MRASDRALSFLRRHGRASVLTAAACALAAPAPASADVLIGATGGYLAVKNAGQRGSNDVIAQNARFLTLQPSDFDGGSIWGEALFGTGRFVELGVGASWYQKTVPSVYRDYLNVNGREVAQEAELRLVPVALTARVFPMGRDNRFQPYVGGGIALTRWNYTESGEFIDFNNARQVFRDTFSDSGTATGPVILGGLRFGVSEALLLGVEGRYLSGRAKLDPAKKFAGDRLDVGSTSLHVTLHVRF